MATTATRPSLADIFGGATTVPRRPRLGDIFGGVDDSDNEDPLARARRLRREREAEMRAMGALPTAQVDERNRRLTDVVDRAGTEILSNLSAPVDIARAVARTAEASPFIPGGHDPWRTLGAVADVGQRALASAESATGLPFTSESQQRHRQRYRELETGLPPVAEALSDAAVSTAQVIDPTMLGLGAVRALRTGAARGVERGAEALDRLANVDSAVRATLPTEVTSHADTLAGRVGRPELAPTLATPSTPGVNVRAGLGQALDSRPPAVVTGYGDVVPTPSGPVYRGESAVADADVASGIGRESAGASSGSHLYGRHYVADREFAADFAARRYGNNGQVGEATIELRRPFSVDRNYTPDELRAIDADAAALAEQRTAGMPVSGSVMHDALRARFEHDAIARGVPNDDRLFAQSIEHAGQRIQAAGYDGFHHEVLSDASPTGSVDAWSVFDDKAPTLTTTPTGATTAAELAPPSSVSDRLFTSLKGAVALRTRQEAIISAERSARLARAADVGTPGGLQGYYAELGQHRGPMEKVAFPSIKSQFTDGEIDAMFTELRDHPELRGYDSLSARTGLLKALNGELPTRGEIALLRRAYGPDNVKALEDAVPWQRRARELAGDVVGVPRSLMATLDLSFPLRQGLVAGTRFPKQWGEAFAAMHKYAASESTFRALAADIQARPTYELMKRSGLALTAEALEPSGAEEQFVSTLAERIPGVGHVVRASDRAYTGMANKLRADVFDHLIATAEKAGRDPVNDVKLTADIARFVNTATGRGDLGGLSAAGNALATTLFSPRLVASRLNMLSPMYYASLDPFVRKEALKSAMSTASFVATVGGIAAAAGAKVSLDPRNADFGKARIGNTRVDLAGGFLQYLRLGAQLATGEVTSSTTGKTTELGEKYGSPTRLDLLWRFAQSKSSPVVGVVLDMLRGKDMLGRDLTASNEVVRHTVPLILQDAYDLWHEDPSLLPLVGLGTYGAGVQTYEPVDTTRFGMTPWGVAADDQTVAPLVAEAQRLGREPDFVSKRVSDPVLDKIVELSPNEYESYIRESGRMAREQLTAMLADPQYASAGPRFQRDAWDHVLSASRQYAKMTILMRRSGH